jgi:transposase-like protein
VRRTHKLRQFALSDIDQALRTAPTLAAAARQLGVAESTLHRWLKAGRVQKPSRARRPRVKAVTGGRPPRSPEGWARSIRRRYALSETEQELVRLATRALALSYNDAVKPETRLAAAARFAALVKQLYLEQEEDDLGETQEASPERDNVRPWPRRIG